MKINYRLLRNMLINFVIAVLSVYIIQELLINVLHVSFSDDLIHVLVVGLSAMIVFILSCDDEE